MSFRWQTQGREWEPVPFYRSLTREPDRLVIRERPAFLYDGDLTDKRCPRFEVAEVRGGAGLDRFDFVPSDPNGQFFQIFALDQDIVKTGHDMNALILSLRLIVGPVEMRPRYDPQPSVCGNNMEGAASSHIRHVRVVGSSCRTLGGQLLFDVFF